MKRILSLQERLNRLERRNAFWCAIIWAASIGAVALLVWVLREATR